MKRQAALALALLGVGSCGSSSDLSGSVSAIFPLAFNQTAIFVNSQSFELAYYLVNAGSEDLVIQITVDLTGIDWQPGASVDLSSQVAPNQPRATVVHQLSGQETLVLPPIVSGTLSLSGGGTVGKLTSGSFQMGFSNTTGVLGGGTTLSGDFSAIARSAAFPTSDGGIPGELCANGVCCVAPCGGVCCQAGESCIAGACCPQPCGTSCCDSSSICFTDQLGNQSCVARCTGNAQCQTAGSPCCAVTPAGNACVPATAMTPSTQCICTQQSDCTSGCCAPALDSTGAPEGPFVCKVNDGSLYDCCNGPQACAQGCCAAYAPAGTFLSNVCVSQCTLDGGAGPCGRAACVATGVDWSYPGGSSCSPTQALCGP